MYIYRCQLTLMEKTFFSSRETSNYYYTEPLIGNYALSYAMGLCPSRYASDGSIHYLADLGNLNDQEVYITPATIQGEPRFFIEQFNAQPESYWFAMGSGVLVTRPDGAQMEQDNKVWYIHKPGKRRKKVSATNRPQYGRIRYLAVGNQAVFYVLSQSPMKLPSYIRLGKFMSKARLLSEEVKHTRKEDEAYQVAFLLNPADLGAKTTLQTYDLVTVPPSPLVKNARLHGPTYALAGNVRLPIGMRFGIEMLEDD